ncbi:MAG TPA: metallophosphoesterase family protein [Planctomycetota bacterium]|jgi:diadenosine tetraphosphatase ApaH/serine/threonine PP2A family protein phosphatase
MRRAIISDIHANLVALEAALADCESQKVDDIVCLGDVCGYGPEPEQCVDTVRQRCTWTLAGNHDTALFMSVAVGFNRFAREAVEWQRSVLLPRWYSLPGTRNRWQWLGNLTPRRIEDLVLYVHASPRDPLMEYVEEGDFADMGFGSTQKAQELFQAVEWLCFCGHTHRPGIVASDFVWFKPSDFPEMTCALKPGVKTIVNIGSVGQPRDGNPLGCYAIYDTEKLTITYRRVAYDIRQAQERFRRVPRLDERLWRRLETGN